MRFDPGHAADVAQPSACLLVEELFPHVAGVARERLIRRVSEFLVTTLSAYCEFYPPIAIPLPSRN